MAPSLGALLALLVCVDGNCGMAKDASCALVSGSASSGDVGPMLVFQAVVVWMGRLGHSIPRR
jgi:hypothetical protein